MEPAYKQLAALHLEIAMYRASVERALKPGGKWVRGTLESIIERMRVECQRFMMGQYAAVVNVSYLAEIGCEYIIRETDVPNVETFTTVTREILQAMAEEVLLRPLPELIRVRLCSSALEVGPSLERLQAHIRSGGSS